MPSSRLNEKRSYALTLKNWKCWRYLDIFAFLYLYEIYEVRRGSVLRIIRCIFQTSVKEKAGDYPAVMRRRRVKTRVASSTLEKASLEARTTEASPRIFPSWCTRSRSIRAEHSRPFTSCGRWVIPVDPTRGSLRRKSSCSCEPGSKCVRLLLPAQQQQS